MIKKIASYLILAFKIARAQPLTPATPTTTNPSPTSIAVNWVVPPDDGFDLRAFTLKILESDGVTFTKYDGCEFMTTIPATEYLTWDQYNAQAVSNGYVLPTQWEFEYYGTQDPSKCDSWNPARRYDGMIHDWIQLGGACTSPLYTSHLDAFGAPSSGYQTTVQVEKPSPNLWVKKNYSSYTPGSSVSCTIASSVLQAAPYHLPDGALVVAQVAAVNEIGSSAFSAANTVGATLTPPQFKRSRLLQIASTPAAPTTALSGANVVITWVAPASATAITGYFVQILSSDGITFYMHSSCNTPGLTCSPTIASLQASPYLLPNNAIVKAKVMANNASGSSAYSAANTAGATLSPPNTPAAPKTAMSGSNTVEITWVAPASCCSPITGYTVAIAQSDGVTFTNHGGCNTSGLTCTVTASSLQASPWLLLSNNVIVQAKVTAINAVGSSAQSAANTAGATLSRPDTPAAPTTALSGNYVVITWVVPASVTPITGHTVAIAQSDGVTFTNYGPCTNNYGNTSPCTIAISTLQASPWLLPNNALVQAKVLATNAIGPGAFSAVNTAGATLSRPNTIAAPTTTLSGNGVYISWVVPASVAPITGHTVAIAQSDGVTFTNYGPCTNSYNYASPCYIAISTLQASPWFLPNNALVQAKVLATNAIGPGAFSAANTAGAILSRPNTIATPTTAFSGGQVVITWVVPASVAPITGHTVAIAQSDGVTFTNYGPCTNSYNYASPCYIPISTLQASPWLLPNNALVQAKVLATNAIGPGAFSAANTAGVILGRPDTPAAPTTALSGNNVVITWVAPTSCCSPITGYSLAILQSDGVTFTDYALCTNVGTATTCSIPISTLQVYPYYLPENALVQAKVRANNAVGSSAYSAANTIGATLSRPNTPAAPTTALSGNNVVITWVAPTSCCSPITGYSLAIVQDDGVTFTDYALCTNVGTATTCSIPISTLQVWPYYLPQNALVQAKVRANNAVGSSAYSAANTAGVTLAPPNPPAAPTTALSGNNVIITWVAPVNLGSQITGYTVAIAQGDGVTFTDYAPCTNVGTAVTCTVAISVLKASPYLLPANAIVKAKVLATSVCGSSAQSAANTAGATLTPPIAPDTPTTALSGNNVIITWVAPFSVTAITGYTVAIAQGDGVTFTDYAPCTNVGGGVTCTVAITVLKASPYLLPANAIVKAKVFATSVCGSSAQSAANTAGAMLTAPSAPAAPTTTISGLNVVITWVAPLANSTPITGYTVAIVQGDDVTFTDYAPCTNVGTAVTCTVAITVLKASPYLLPANAIVKAKVFASSVCGSSAQSAANTAGAMLTAPSAPAAPTTTISGLNVVITWVAPSAGVAPITGYSVAIVQGDGVTFTDYAPCTNVGTAVTCTVAITVLKASPYLLPANAIVKAKVLASSICGNGAQSAANTVGAMLTAPSAPAAPTTTISGLNVVITWVAPLANSTPITGYTVAIVQGDDVTFTEYPPCTNVGTAVTCTVAITVLKASPYLLPANAIVKAKVLASSICGNGSQSAANTVGATLTAPSAPATPTTTISGLNVVITWVAPLSAFPITGYTVAIAQGNGVTFTDYAPCTNVGTAVTCTVAITVLKASPYLLPANAVVKAKVLASSICGDGAYSTPGTITLTAPSAPAAPTMAILGTNVVITWVTPSAGATPITGYTVQILQSDGVTYTTLAPCTNAGTGVTCTVAISALKASPYVLTAGSAVNARVLATSICGDGAYSTPGTITLTAPSAPAAPTMAISGTNVVITWVTPSAGATPITGYTLQIRQSDGVTFTDYAPCSNVGTAVTCTVAISVLQASPYLLPANAAVNARVLASSICGDGAYSTPGTITLTAPNAPAAPTMAISGTNVVITWVTPSAGATPITGYTVQILQSDGVTYTTLAPCTNVGTGVTCTVPISVLQASPYFLTAGSDVYARVLASNICGDGVFSPPGTGVTLTKPSAPAAPTTTNPSETSIRIAWVAPLMGSTAITGYILQIRLSDNVTFQTYAACTNVGIAVSCSINNTELQLAPYNLSNGALVVAQISAVNEIGSSAFSAANTYGAVLPNVPASPVSPTTSISGNNVVIDWVAPANQGSTITGYTVAIIQSDGVTFTPYAPCTNVGTSVTCTAAIIALKASPYSLPANAIVKAKVLATNAIGSSLQSAANTVTLTAPSAPATPTMAISGNNVVITWVAPPAGATSITGYTVQIRQSDGVTYTTLAPCTNIGTGVTCTVAISALKSSPYLLTAGSDVYARVLASSVCGDSAYSPPGTGVTLTPPSAPGAPTTAISGSNFLFTWIAPPAGVTPITGYTVQILQSDGATYTTLAPCTNVGTGVTCTVAISVLQASPYLLSAGTDVYARVLASSVCGDSAYSPPGTVSLIECSATPTMSISGSNVVMSWVAPSAGVTPITGYTVQILQSDGVTYTTHAPCTNVGTGVTCTVPISVLQASPYFLTAGFSVYAKVLASSICVDGVQSPAGTGVTLTTPSSPDAPTMKISGTNLVITWVQPSAGAISITGYTVQILQNDSAAYTTLAPCTNVGTGVTCTVPISVLQASPYFLTAGSDVYARVLASNICGDGVFSPPGTGVTLTTPSAPAAPTTTNPTETSIRIAWVAPLMGSTAITGYTLQIRLSDNVTFQTYTPCTNVGTGVTCTIALSVLQESPYKFADGDLVVTRVAASNQIGSSAFSAASTATLKLPQQTQAQLTIANKKLNAEIGKEASLIISDIIGVEYRIISKPAFQATVKGNQLKVLSMSKSDIGTYLLEMRASDSRSECSFSVIIVFSESPTATAVLSEQNPTSSTQDKKPTATTVLNSTSSMSSTSSTQNKNPSATTVLSKQNSTTSTNNKTTAGSIGENKTTSGSIGENKFLNEENSAGQTKTAESQFSNGVDCTAGEDGTITCKGQNGFSFQIDTLTGKTVEKPSTAKVAAPTLTVSKVNSLGEFKFKFSEPVNLEQLLKPQSRRLVPMKSRMNGTKASNSSEDNSDFLLSTEHLLLTVKSLNTTTPAFSWHATKITSTEIFFQLLFQDPLYISMIPGQLDKLVVTILPPCLKYLKSKKSGLLPENVLTNFTLDLPQQVVQGDAIQAAEKASSSLGEFGIASTLSNVGVQIVLSGTMTQMWSMVNSEGIILSLTLLNNPMPGNVLTVMSNLDGICNFDVFPTKAIMEYTFNFTATTYPGVGFAQMGKDTKSLTLILGPTFIIMLLLGLHYLLYGVAFGLRNHGRLMNWIEQKLRPGLLALFYRFLIQSYLNWGIGTGLRLEEPKFQTGSDYFDIVLSCVGILISFLFLLFCFCFLREHVEQLDDPEFKSKHETLYSGFLTDTPKKREEAAKMTPWYLFRRTFLGVNLVFLRAQTIWIQLALNMYLCLADLAVSLNYSPFVSRLARFMDIFNNIMVLMCSYVCFMFTDATRTQEDKYYIGWYFVGLVGLMLCANLLLMCFTTSVDVKKKIQQAVTVCQRKKKVDEQNKKRRLQQEAMDRVKALKALQTQMSEDAFLGIESLDERQLAEQFRALKRFERKQAKEQAIQRKREATGQLEEIKEEQEVSSSSYYDDQDDFDQSVYSVRNVQEKTIQHSDNKVVPANDNEENVLRQSELLHKVRPRKHRLNFVEPEQSAQEDAIVNKADAIEEAKQKKVAEQKKARLERVKRCLDHIQMFVHESERKETEVNTFDSLLSADFQLKSPGSQLMEVKFLFDVFV